MIVPATNNKLHVVIVSNSLNPGGGVSNVFRSHVIFLSAHFSITVITAEGKIEGVDYDAIIVERPKLFWLRRFGHAIREWILCKRYFDALCRVHKRKNIDFVIYHSHTGLAISGVRFREISGAGIACVTHGDVFTRPKGTYDWLLTKLYKWSTLKSYRQSDLIISSSPFMAQCALTRGANPKAVKVIPNGVMIDYEQKQVIESDSQNHKDLKLLYVGRLSIEKDPYTLIKAFARVVNDVGLILTIVGDGPLMKNCKNLCEQLNIADRVTFTGHVGKDAVESIYQSHDMFCITSVSDPLPAVVLEAMAHGLPVIGADAEGIPFMVQENITGLLFNPGDVGSLSNSIEKLCSDAKMRKSMSRAGKYRAETEFSWPKITAVLKDEIIAICVSE